MTLTVTDDRGAKDSVTQTLVVAVPVGKALSSGSRATSDRPFLGWASPMGGR